MPRLTGRGLVVCLLAGLAVAILYAGHWALRDYHQGRSIEWDRYLVRGLADWTPWLVLVPVIAAVCRRYPVTALAVEAPLAAHAVAAVLLAVVQTAMVYAIGWIDLGIDALNVADVPAPRDFYMLLGRKLETNVIAYVVIAGTLHAVAAHRVAMERQTLADRAAASAQRARLEALHAQLNPHYVYNALNTVAELSYSAPEQARAVAGKLARLLRSADAPSGTVLLGDELSRTEDYLQIEAIRFADRLRTCIDVPSELLALAVPPYAIQTLAENAIRHGLARTRGQFRIELRARRADDMLVIDVLDTGPGLDPAEGAGGVGLSNLRERLAILYGDRATFGLTHGNHGTIATLRVPIT